MRYIKEFGSLLKETFSEWKDDKASRLAAALAYYTIFSIAPLLLLIVAIVGIVFDRSTVEGELFDQIGDLVGRESAASVQEIVHNVDQAEGGTIATIASIVTLILGASGVFGQLQSSLNTIWDVAPKPGVGLMATLRTRLLSFAMVPAIGFLLLVSLAVDAVLAVISTYFSDLFPSQFYIVLLQIISIVVSIGVITLLFMLIYRVLPDVHISWSDVWIGAAVTALLFTIGRVAIGLYIGNSSTASAYGAAGSLIVILLWVYYSAQLLFFGAEFTQVYARRYGRGIVPTKNAILLDFEDRFEQGVAGRKEIEAIAHAQQQHDAPRSPERAARTAEQDKSLLPSQRRNKTLVNVGVAGMLSFVLGAIAGFIGKKTDSTEA